VFRYIHFKLTAGMIARAHEARTRELTESTTNEVYSKGVFLSMCSTEYRAAGALQHVLAWAVDALIRIASPARNFSVQKILLLDTLQ